MYFLRVKETKGYVPISEHVNRKTAGGLTLPLIGQQPPIRMSS